jgi:uncharacterized membrane protein YfhO
MLTRSSRFYSNIIAFFIPFLLLGGVFAAWKVYPFGNGSILMADEYSQYIQFYNHLYDVLKGNGSLLYSWEAGMGLNFWGTFAYYLSSPISVIIFLFNPSHLPEAFVLMILIKIGLSGLMMNIYLSKMYPMKKQDLIIFSTLYSLISFSIGYLFNIMWLDSIYLLPIVLLGIEYLFCRKPLLFIISLTLLFISNFYMAYIVGLFTFLFFLYRSITLEKNSRKNFIRNFLSFGFSTIVAAGISAFITLPTYLLLKSNPNQPFKWDEMWNIQFGFFELIAKFYNSSVRLFDLPNVYSGLVVLLLAPLFFINSKIKSREKIASFIFLLILFFSLQLNGFNLMWHAFSAPTGYYYRFAFVVSFFMIYLSYKSYLVLDPKIVPSIYKVYIANIFILMLLTKLTPELMSVAKALLNIILLTVFCFLLYKKATLVKPSRAFSLVILLFICFDLGLNSYQHIKILKSNPGYDVARSQYNLPNKSFATMVKELNQDDQGFYRTNSITGLTINDSIRFGYKGMTNFNTLGNGALHEFMNTIGYSSTLGQRSLVQNQGILTSDALFGFKYMISDKPSNKFGYTEVKCENGICLYKNQYAMPIGFMVDAHQFTFDMSVDNPFDKQNRLLGPVNNQDQYFQPLKASSITYHNLTVTNEGNILSVKKLDTQQRGSIEMVFNIKGEKQFYALLSAGKGFAGYGDTNLYINGKSLGIYPTYHNDRVIDLGAFSNEKVTVNIELNVPETQLTQQLFYSLDIPSFSSRITELRKGSMDVTSWSETSVSGNITAKKKGTLFFSIPYDKGWKATVDGKQESIIKLGGFIGLNLEKGKHDLTLSYLPEGFKLGCLISTISIIFLIGINVVSIIRNRARVIKKVGK